MAAKSVWIYRENDRDGNYVLYNKKPVFGRCDCGDEDCKYLLVSNNAESVWDFCSKLFHKFTTLRLKKGEVAKVVVNMDVIIAPARAVVKPGDDK